MAKSEAMIYKICGDNSQIKRRLKAQLKIYTLEVLELERARQSAQNEVEAAGFDSDKLELAEAEEDLANHCGLTIGLIKV